MPDLKADRHRIERDLAELISIPSVTGDEYAAQDAVAAKLVEEGIIVERVDRPVHEVSGLEGFPGMEMAHSSFPLVVGRISGQAPGPTLMLQGHVDVVPPGDPDTWTTPPFEPSIRDGMMYGRGACDMKGGVVAILEAMRMIMGRELIGEVMFVAVPAEEDGGGGAFAAIQDGFVADACVITEPTGMNVVVAHGGALTFTLEVPGKAAHASMRKEGVSALDNLAYLVDALSQDEATRNATESHPLMQAIGLPYPTIIGQVDGGNWTSTVMDNVNAHGRYGVRLGQNCEGAAEDLRRAIESASAEHSFLGDNPPTVTVWGGQLDSSSIPTDHSLPVGLQAASESAGHRTPSLIGAPYGADMRLYINQGNTPTVMYGPGDVAHAHSADEHVPIDGSQLESWLAGTTVTPRFRTPLEKELSD